VPGTGTPATQVHDFNGGVLPSGLFWTVGVRRDAIRFTDNGRRAVFKVRDLPVIDTFQFGGAFMVPALVDFEVTWEAKGPAATYGSGKTVPATDHAAFVGRFAEAKSEVSCSGSELGFTFRGEGRADHARGLGWAHIGSERNGAFLT
jgi:hypothetical protein